MYSTAPGVYMPFFHYEAPILAKWAHHAKITYVTVLEPINTRLKEHINNSKLFKIASWTVEVICCDVEINIESVLTHSTCYSDLTNKDQSGFVLESIWRKKLPPRIN